MAMGLTDADLIVMNRVRADAMVYIGVDLGQRGSHSAIVIVETFEEWPSDLADVLRGMRQRTRYVVRHAEQIPLGTPYREVIARVQQIVERIKQTSRKCVVVVDESGAGVPIVERMREVVRACGIIPYIITSGQESSGSTVPRAELLTTMQLMAEHDELEIAAGCRHGEQLQKELVHLQLKGGGSSAVRDDLALALALACWKARRR